MPPRYAYWTIIIDNAPTAFRAREKAELVPTFRQLSRTNPNAVIKWFSRGRLWESPEEAREAAARPRAPEARRGRQWRPGGTHVDPRSRLAKESKSGREGERASRPPRDGQRSDRRPGRSGKPSERGAERRAGKDSYRDGNRRRARNSDRERNRPLTGDRDRGERPPKTSDSPTPEPPAPAPPQPPGPDRPPRPGEEPEPNVPEGETIKILPDPPERAK